MDTEAPQAPRRHFTPPEIIEVRQVRDFLSSHFTECYSAPGEACGTCEQCVISKAVERLEEIVEPPDLPVEKYRDRLRHNDGVNCEAYFLAVWQDEQGRERRLGSRRISILEHILGERPTFRDAAVAASLIQWLGTNVGRGVFKQMIRAAERCEEDVAAKRKEEQRRANSPHNPEDA